MTNRPRNKPMEYYRTVATTCILIAALLTAGMHVYRESPTIGVGQSTALARNGGEAIAASQTIARSQSHATNEDLTQDAATQDADSKAATKAAKEKTDESAKNNSAVPSEDASSNDPSNNDNNSESAKLVLAQNSKGASSNSKSASKDASKKNSGKSETKASDGEASKKGKGEQADTAQPQTGKAQKDKGTSNTEASESKAEETNAKEALEQAAQASDPQNADQADEDEVDEEVQVTESVEELETLVHPLSFVWECGQDFGGIAPDDGSLSEWAPHYYVAHAYGPYGEDILCLEPGDTVTVNGNLVTVEGDIVMPLYSPYEDVMDAVGWDATVFQTCIPDTNDCRFVYARGETSTPEAAREARRWAGYDIKAEEVPAADGETRSASRKESAVIRTIVVRQSRVQEPEFTITVEGDPAAPLIAEADPGVVVEEMPPYETMPPHQDMPAQEGMHLPYETRS
ncbi:MAG: hypothetical protein IKG21_04475 [Atopobiaceae bacterium]|nr:hypothetical protein [Atopobiaceae bacterium]